MVSISSVAALIRTEARLHSDTALPDLHESKETGCMFHCTRLEFLDEILKYGLVPIRPLDRIIDGQRCSPLVRILRDAVFVSEQKFKWMHWAQGLPNGDVVPGAIITLNVDGLEKIRDPSENHDGDWAVLERILPDRFLQIAVSSSGDPCNFKEFTRRPNNGP